MKIKICGLSTPETVTAAIHAGADFIGFVFYAPSPRNIDVQMAAYLRSYCPPAVQIVPLLVDPDDALIDEIMSALNPHLIQLHGAEMPDRVAAIKSRTQIPVMKAFRIGGAEDVDQIKHYEDVCDWLLMDAKPQNAMLPGGTGHRFDWTLLRNRMFIKPWMLSGGLNAKNIKDALAILKPDALDVSSGVETMPGRKDAAKIKIFLETAKNYESLP